VYTAARQGEYARSSSRCTCMHVHVTPVHDQTVQSEHARSKRAAMHEIYGIKTRLKQTHNATSPLELPVSPCHQHGRTSQASRRTKLDQKGREWWGRVARASLAGRSGGKGQDQQGCEQQNTRHETNPTRQHSHKTSSPALHTHGVISQSFTISSHPWYRPYEVG